ncbi:cation:proton antiporter [Candidatus Woesearchaeota archaeon]|nr:cation:proton antiporter [Candidatus Woesearchaeota archaeon]
MAELFLFEIGLLLLAAALFANLSRFIKQPLILGYVFAGILLGPIGFNLLKDQSLISLLIELGIAFLLFLVGLELDLRKLKEVGSLVSITGIIQVVLITVLGVLISRLWLDTIQSIYVGIILAFSSTMVVAKLLSDHGEIDTLHGRIIIGILLVQDVLAILALPLLTNKGTFNPTVLFLAFSKGIFLLVFAYLATKYIFHRILRYGARNPELLFITSVAICFFFANLALMLGFSLAIGAFVAGVSLASFPYTTEIIGRIKSLKDFFAILFFVALGTQLTFTGFSTKWTFFLFLLGMTLIFKPLIIFIILKMYKHSNRTTFTAGLSLAQVSEFSLVLATEGLLMGRLEQNTFNMILLTAIITIPLTSYLIKYHHSMYQRLEHVLLPFDRMTKQSDLEYLPQKLENHVVLFGAHRMGARILQTLKKIKTKYVVVDFNPDCIRSLVYQKVPCIYGDYGNIDVLHEARLGKAKFLISTIPGLHENILLIKLARGSNPKAVIFVTAKHSSDAIKLYEHGADFVAVPEFLAGQKIGDYLTHLKIPAIRKWGTYYYQEMLKEQNK